ncbi:hypothetical protein BV898_01730 [Hypsibius exemplaris]|uniref:XK-related protein n=1 Tax=Hypsibius exemplaris TaxID=2072580 RepID=A0A1W0XBL3_HYPEX|nr:hypothetical protein BV898_01730 [Hypsibius exemplaris]
MHRQIVGRLQSLPHFAAPDLKEPFYHPLILQCGPDTSSTKNSFSLSVFRHLRTWFVCWPDHCHPSGSVVFWTIFSVIFYFADIGADLSVAFEYLDSKDYIWFSLLFSFTFLPMFIAVAYEVGYKRRVWYEVYPFGLFYWCKNIQSSEDAKIYLFQLRTFQECNRERNRVGDVDIYFGAMPQLILQSYIAAAVAIETGVYTVTFNSWVSLALSSLSLLRYEPGARESKKGIIIDIETVLEPALYDYIAENLSDLMSLVPRAMAIGCFLTVKPTFASAIAFFAFHITVTFLWFWRSAPKRIPSYRSTDRDFRGNRRDR